MNAQAKPSLLAKFGDRYAVDPNKMFETLKATAFKQRDGSAPSNEQMMALLVVADQYRLNPFTREIYAFPDKQNGIVPVVGVDGWSRIINGHPEFDGMEFRYSDALVTPPGASAPSHEWVECVMYRKDRGRPIVVREYLDEVYRAPFKEGMKGPWQTHTKRFLRHKAMIQCARLAFGFVGIFDEDEAGRIAEQSERDMGAAQVVREQAKALPACPEEQIEKYAAVVESGQRPAEQIISMLQTRYELTPGQRSALLEVATTQGDQA
ncbi:phage recombination protein Bet [Isoalcanivorax beigongshangi]|uniref:Phage recombination protein Bet n=1 Tax=Isoalcanivorax beigongshangi TaxID=3238810 RepID=A0ABV4AIU5_9GAMM